MTVDLEQLAYTVNEELPPDEGWIEVSILPAQVVARAHVARHDQTTIIKFITVHEAFRHQGIARRLVEILKKTSREVIAQGVRFNARNFWLNVGFQPKGKNYHWAKSSMLTHPSPLDEHRFHQ